MKRLVIGRTGQLARALTATDPTIIALGRETVDLTDARAITAVLEAHRPAVVINAAAYTAVDKAEEDRDTAYAVNRDGVGALAAAAAAHGAALIHVSTDYVFDGAGDRAWTEDDAPAPLSVYGASKRAGEIAAQEANPRTLTLRTSWVYSPWGRNFVTTMLGLAGRDRLTVVDDQVGKPTSALDLAEAILAIAPRLADTGANAPFWGVRHYAGAGVVSWASFARAIFEAARDPAFGPLIDQTPEVAAIASADWPTAATRPLNSALDCSRFEADFAVATTPWTEALRRVLAQIAQTKAAA